MTPVTIDNVEQLENLLSEPPAPVIEAMGRLEGDIILLGAGGKIGPSLGRMAKRASDLAGVSRRIIAVSRFSSPAEEAGFRARGIETVKCDLLDAGAVARLPEAPNVIYLAGFKFGAAQDAARTWAMNTYLPSIVCPKYRTSRIVAFSTGTVYGLAPLAGGGSRETDTPKPVGEYAMSCLGRERMFEYFSRELGFSAVLLRLFYASELRYGVLVDLAFKIMSGEPIDLATGAFNIIWQGDSNAATLLSFGQISRPPAVLNIAGLETLGTRQTALELGRRLGREPVFCGAETESACLANASNAARLFGPPRVGPEQLIGWVADWVKRGGPSLGKPTHFESRDGIY
jgi:nucleoside-diphosphate-sugar epimerase